MAISTGTVTTGTSTSQNNSITVSHEVVSGTKLLVACVGWSWISVSGDPDPNGATWDGTSMVVGPAYDPPGVQDGGQSVFYIVDPEVGTLNFVANWSGQNSTWRTVALVNVSGDVDTTTPVGATVASNGNDNSPTVNITSTVAGSLLIGGLAVQGGDADPFSPGNPTELADFASGTATSSDGAQFLGKLAAPTTQSYTFDATAAVSDKWGIAVIEVLPLVETTAVAPLSAAATLTAQTQGADASDFLWSPPTLINPTIVNVTEDGVINFPPSGDYGQEEDVLLLMSTTEVRTTGMRIHGGRNVRMVGGHIILETPVDFTPAAISIEAPAGIFFMEGTHIDVNRLVSDAVYTRAHPWGTAAGDWDFYLQQVKIEGIEGTTVVHGDCLQFQQSGNAPGNLFIEHCSFWSGYNTFVINSGAIDKIWFKDFDFHKEDWSTHRQNSSLSINNIVDLWFDNVWFDTVNDGGTGATAILSRDNTGLLGDQTQRGSNIVISDGGPNGRLNEADGPSESTDSYPDTVIVFDGSVYTGTVSGPDGHIKMGPNPANTSQTEHSTSFSGQFVEVNSIGLNYISPHDGEGSSQLVVSASASLAARGEDSNAMAELTSAASIASTPIHVASGVVLLQPVATLISGVIFGVSASSSFLSQVGNFMGKKQQP